MNVDIGLDEKPVLGELGKEFGKGWYQDVSGIHTRLHDYWSEVTNNDLIPEVRLRQAPKKPGTHMLFVRDTAYLP